MAWTQDELDRRAILEAGGTVAVNVRRTKGPHRNLVPWAKERGLLVYVGHRVRWTDWPQTPWANPFRPSLKELEGMTRRQAQALLRKYRDHVMGDDDLVEALEGLKGCALACWCVPSPCHAQVLVDLVKTRTSPLQLA